MRVLVLVIKLAHVPQPANILIIPPASETLPRIRMRALLRRDAPVDFKDAVFKRRGTEGGKGYRGGVFLGKLGYEGEFERVGGGGGGDLRTLFGAFDKGGCGGGGVVCCCWG